MTPKNKHKHFWTLKRKAILIGALSTLLIVAFLGITTKLRKDELELRQIKTQNVVNRDVQKVAEYAMSCNSKLWPSLANEIATAIVNSSLTYKVPLDILVGIVAVESEFNIFVVSKANAKGLCQVRFESWPEIKVENVYEPEQNCNSAAWILNRLIKEHKLKKAIELYNIGEGNFKKGVRNREYVSKIFEKSAEFRYFDTRK